MTRLFTAGGFAGLALVAGLAAAVHGAELAKPRPQHGKASWFGREVAGKTTASGKPARPGAMTAASRTLPLGTKARVTNKETGKSVRVTVTDRGPYAKGRVVDVSRAAAEKLGMKEDGTASVKVTPLEVPKD